MMLKKLTNNIQVLKDETKTAMRLLGVERVDQLGMQHVSDTTISILNEPFVILMGFADQCSRGRAADI